jgi:hypothetical protein
LGAGGGSGGTGGTGGGTTTFEFSITLNVGGVPIVYYDGKKWATTVTQRFADGTETLTVTQPNGTVAVISSRVVGSGGREAKTPSKSGRISWSEFLKR